MSEPKEVAPKAAPGFLSQPATGVGRWSAWLLVVSLALVLLNNIVVMPETERNMALELVQRLLNLSIFLCIVVTGLLGLWAIIMKRERSWVLFLSLLLLIFVVVMNVGPLLHGGMTGT